MLIRKTIAFLSFEFVASRIVIVDDLLQVVFMRSVTNLSEIRTAETRTLA